MKYLYKFESIDEDMNSKFREFMNRIEDDVNNYLSYLKDDGNKVNIDSSEGRNILPMKVSHDRLVNITITLGTGDRYGLYRWDYIKYSIIPFITIIEGYSKIVKFKYKDSNNEWNEFDIKKIKEDLILNNTLLSKIIIEIDPNIIKNKTIHRIKNFLNIK